MTICTLQYQLWQIVFPIRGPSVWYYLYPILCSETCNPWHMFMPGPLQDPGGWAIPCFIHALVYVGGLCFGAALPMDEWLYVPVLILFISDVRIPKAVPSLLGDCPRSSATLGMHLSELKGRMSQANVQCPSLTPFWNWWLCSSLCGIPPEPWWSHMPSGGPTASPLLCTPFPACCLTGVRHMMVDLMRWKGFG